MHFTATALQLAGQVRNYFHHHVGTSRFNMQANKQYNQHNKLKNKSLFKLYDSSTYGQVQFIKEILD
jgi:hypothetical protein